MRKMRAAGGAWTFKMKAAWRVWIKVGDEMIPQKTNSLMLDCSVGLGDINGRKIIPEVYNSVEVKVSNGGKVAEVMS